METERFSVTVLGPLCLFLSRSLSLLCQWNKQSVGSVCVCVCVCACVCVCVIKDVGVCWVIRCWQECCINDANIKTEASKKCTQWTHLYDLKRNMLRTFTQNPKCFFLFPLSLIHLAVKLIICTFNVNQGFLYKTLYLLELNRSFFKWTKPLLIRVNFFVFSRAFFWRCAFKGIVHPKMNILSSFIHPSLVPNLYDFLPSV